MTFPGWLDRIGSFNVSRQEGPRPGGQAYLKLDTETKRVIWHTTEGSSVDGAVARLRENFSCPHFVIGEGQIAQMRPLWAEAATVRGDNSNAWQVEVVGFSQTAPWVPEDPSLQPMLALLGFFRDTFGVPLVRPDGWRDDCADIEGVWATLGNSRRVSGRAPRHVGHVMHLEWPENTHWDQGAVRWSHLFELVEDEDVTMEQFQAGWQAHRSGVTRNPDWPEHKKFGWNAREEAVENPKLEAHEHVGYAAKSHTHPPGAHDHPDLARAGHGHQVFGEAQPTG